MIANRIVVSIYRYHDGSTDIKQHLEQITMRDTGEILQMGLGVRTPEVPLSREVGSRLLDKLHTYKPSEDQ